MSLKGRIHGAVDRFYDITSSLQADVKYLSVGGDTDHANYSPATGTLATTESRHSTKALLVAVTQEEMQRFGLQITDRKAIINRRGFPFVPDVEDQVEIVSGPNVNATDVGNWEVTKIMSEPSASVYILAIRRT